MYVAGESKRASVACLYRSEIFVPIEQNSPKIQPKAPQLWSAAEVHRLESEIFDSDSAPASAEYTPTPL